MDRYLLDSQMLFDIGGNRDPPYHTVNNGKITILLSGWIDRFLVAHLRALHLAVVDVESKLARSVN
jgi:hypothetical protein